MNSYRKTLWCCVLIVTLFMAAGVVTARAGDGTADAQTDAYTLGVFDGVVAVYVGGEETPSIRTDIFMSELRAADRELVSGGIAVDSYGELLRLIEDLSS